MPDTTRNEPVDPIDDSTTIQPVPEVPAPTMSDAAAQPIPAMPAPAQPDVLADVNRPVGSSYDPMPLQGQIDTSRNWMGIVALIFGIIGGSIIAIVFGILGLNAVKQGKATNRGMNIWGIVLGVVWLLIGIAVSVALIFFIADATSKTAAVGNCYASAVTTEDDLLDSSPVVIGCSAITNGEVYYIASYDGAYVPGDAEFTSDLYTFCTTDAALANVDVEVAQNYQVETYVPNASTWDEDPHTIVCGVANPSGRVDEGAVTGD